MFFSNICIIFLPKKRGHAGSGQSVPVPTLTAFPPSVFYKTHRLASRVLLIAARQGVTDEQICDVLLQGVPHLTDPASLQDSRAGKKQEDTDTTESGKQSEAKETSYHNERMKRRSATECVAVAPLGLLLLESLHKTHRQASRLLLIPAREGATDEQICHVR